MRPDDLPPDWRFLFEERAAIKEYDGRMCRQDAERQAMIEIRKVMEEANGATRIAQDARSATQRVNSAGAEKTQQGRF